MAINRDYRWGGGGVTLMKRYTIEKLYIKTQAPDPVSDILTNILRESPKDLVAVMRAGCTIDTSVSNGVIKISTRYPVSILKDEKGNVLDIIEKK